MGLKSALIVITRRIGEAVKKVAADHGLRPDQYALAGSYSEDSERVYLTLGVVPEVDEYQLFSDLVENIQDSLPELPQFQSHCNLVIRRVERLDDLYFEARDVDGELDLSERFESVLARV